MIKKIKNYTIVAMSAFALLAPVAITSVASAQTDLMIGQQSCAGSNADLSGANRDCTNGETKLNSLIKTIINILSIIVGVVAVIMIIFGGLKYITSNGDSGNVSSAKNTIIFALVGLVIVAVAQFIVHFVLNKVNTGTP